MCVRKVGGLARPLRPLHRRPCDFVVFSEDIHALAFPSMSCHFLFFLASLTSPLGFSGFGFSSGTTFVAVQSSVPRRMILCYSCLRTSCRYLCCVLRSLRCSEMDTIRDMNISETLLSPRPPSFLGEQRRSTLLFLWKFPP